MKDFSFPGKIHRIERKMLSAAGGFRGRGCCEPSKAPRGLRYTALWRAGKIFT